MLQGTIEAKAQKQAKCEGVKRMNSFTKYGDFSKDGTEFIITRPDTPRPWANYITNGRYCLILSQTAGGYSFYLDAEKNRISRWLNENYLIDRPGRYLYIKDTDSGDYWSATYQPVRKSGGYECIHGLGYSIIKGEKDGLKSEVKFFVPKDDDLEVWHIKLSNTTSKAKNLKVFPFVEWLLGNFIGELTMHNISILINRGNFDQELQVPMVTKFPAGGKPWPYQCFISSSLPVKGFDIDFEKFIGKFRDHSNPIAVEENGCSNSDDVKGMNMVGALEHDIALGPNETKEFSIIVGIVKTKNEAKKLISKYRNLDNVKIEFEKTKEGWRKSILDNFQVETPDAEFNRAVNVWIKYQVYMNNYWGRSATFYHEGMGEFGYRNTAQDAWGMVPLNLNFAKERLLKLAFHQRKSGQPLPGWSEEAGATTHKPPSDFPIWLPFLLNAYIKESGEFALLKKKIKFFDGGVASLYEHALRATKFLMDIGKSKRGLPLMGSQDWNDAFDRCGTGGKGESVWLGMGLCFALKNMQELANFIGDKKTVKDCQVRYEKMKAIINKYAWEGDRYIYGFNDFGEPLGSKKTKEGSLQLNSQTWAILAGIPDEGKLKKILKLIDTDLATPYGPSLFTPPYTKYDIKIGRITAFAPGTKENAAIFCHGGAFKIVADLKIKRAKEAYETFKTLLPTASNKDIEVYLAEPYIFAEYLIGKGNPRYGEGAFTWLTGSADWMLFAALEWILGIKPEYDGLKIDPCIPSGWKSYKVKKLFRGSFYDIIVENPKGKEHGEVEITVDGKKSDSNIIKPFNDKKTHLVKVRII